ncbi:MAG: hypothetical protein LBJ00_14495 [Planctomycetaceae bacterium]|nr:hypothetical protein [Planctomycetaceae bacterium]
MSDKITKSIKKIVPQKTKNKTNYAKNSLSYTQAVLKFPQLNTQSQQHKAVRSLSSISASV